MLARTYSQFFWGVSDNTAVTVSCSLGIISLELLQSKYQSAWVFMVQVNFTPADVLAKGF